VGDQSAISPFLGGELSEVVELIDATVGRGAISILSSALVDCLHQC